jgi:RND family efflux transporter MFP subunit
MADSPEDRSRLDASTEASALAELALCESLSQISGWAAKWSAELTGADAALLWAPDTVHPIYLSIGAHGRGTEKLLRKSVPQHEGFLRDVLRDKRAATLDRIDFAGSKDPLLGNFPADMDTALVVPLEAEGLSVGVLALLFRKRPDTTDILARVKGFVLHAAPALARALRAERKTIGMLRAIERLTNLYDLSKAFGSTIDKGELTELIARKAVDLAAAEVCSLWNFEPREFEVALGASAVNENYDVENAPDAVGASIVGDIIADQKTMRRNALPASGPLSQETPGYSIRSMLALPLVEENMSVGALVFTNKRGRVPEFTPQDEELLQDLARQAVRALRIARQHEAEKKVQELGALLTVSREITATLDLDKVMATIVNATVPLIAYDRCAIAIMDRGKVRIGAVSGKAKIDRKDPQIQRLEDLLQWTYFSGSDVAVTGTPDGRIVTDRPETEEKFRAHFQDSGYRSFYGMLLKDEEGTLGVLSFERRTPLVVEEGVRDLLSILINQATVAVRNAQLYTQVPLAGFWKPILARRQKFMEMPRSNRLAYAIGGLVLLLTLVFLPWRPRVSGPARILPGQRASVTAGVDGIITSVLRREGDSVGPGDVIATLRDESYEAALEEARSSFAVADSEVARYREAGDAGAMFEAQSKRTELAAKIALAADQLARTRVRAPVGGVIMTPRLEERVGQFFPRGSELCVIGDISTVTVEVAVPESEVVLVHPGDPVSVKLNSYPTRLFRGSLTRIGSQVREDGKERFVISEVSIANAGGSLKTGMLGRAKVSTRPMRLIQAVFRKPARYIWRKVWPLLP